MTSKGLITIYLQMVKAKQLLTTVHTAKILTIQPFRNSSFRSSKPVGPSSLYTDVEISKSPEEWKYVERLLPSKFIPEPAVKSEYPSGWIPPSEVSCHQPYYVERNRNHMFPLYLKIQGRGEQKTTKLKRIQGDIWALHDDLKKYLKERSKRHVFLQVLEVSGHINIKGDHFSIVEEWLQDRGF